ncbi:MAG: V-type ATPase subunit [Clostridiales bacterium]|nr:V-type ATPase subunit [Clostridiales bacterium]
MIHINHASNAVSAKARTLYGRRLSDKDYAYLCECKNVSEIAAYLKAETHYGKYLPSFHNIQIHRGMLETLVRKSFYEECSALCKYEITVGDFFYRYIIDVLEINDVLKFLTLLSAGKNGDFEYTAPVYIDRHSNMDLNSLKNVSTYEQLLRAAYNTPYYDIFANHPPKDGVYDLALIECELNNSLYDSVIATINRHTHGEEKKQLNRLFGNMLSAKNLDVIYRLKKYYNMSEKNIYKLMLNHSSMSKKQLDALINADSELDFYNILNMTSLGRKLRAIMSDNSLTDSMTVFKESTSLIRRSSYPSVVLASYLFLSEIEVTNVFNIIEGVRYNASPEIIKEMLIK